ncbi:MAG: MFS transporter [Verrucomicrobiota bacterium]|jgi:predicted MFS family arabinose efflux permease
MTIKKGLRFKTACYTIEGMNSFATVLFFNYLYFFMQARHGFSDKDNLAFAALLGLAYTFGSWQAGRFARRHGYFTALKLGFSIMLVSLAVGSQLNSAPGQILAAIVVTLGMCLIWPTIEALVSEGETPEGVPRAVGLYNITWAVANAIAYFIGGTFIQTFGFRSIFYLPIGIVLIQLALTFWLQNHATELARLTVNKPPAAPPPPDPHRPSPAKAKAFLRMAWLANPFAYIAINTFIAVIPGLAARLHLSPMLAGFTCSLWCFARLGIFLTLWSWTGWHYRFRWLVTAFGLLVVSFAAILIVPSLAVLLVAQIFFGVAIGLIYYSSLFYSMDASEIKSEHGGIHEAAIGVGNCLGPAVGAASLQFLPQYANSGALAVSALLLCGFGALLTIWKTAR